MSQYYEEKLCYPPGVKELTEDISTGELQRRLKGCLAVLQNMNQEEDNSMYLPFALHLASDFFLEHPSRDIRLTVANCIADIFRIFAPDYPFTDTQLLKAIFMLFIDMLKDLSLPNDTNFRSHFYLLENLTIVKTFNVCVEAADHPEIVERLFEVMLHVVSVNDNIKVRRNALTMLSQLIEEDDSLPQKVVANILLQIVEPYKSESKRKCDFAQDLLKRTATYLEQEIHNIFNGIMKKEFHEDLSNHRYDLMYELNVLVPSAMIVYVNNLGPKLTVQNLKERFEVTTLLARMFADKSNNMIEQNKSLWTSYLGRFNDIAPEIRKICITYSKPILLNHPESRVSLIEGLSRRIFDPDEDVRMKAIKAMMDVAITDFYYFPMSLYEEFLKRSLDKNFEVRKAVLLGLAQIYQKQMETSAVNLISIEEDNFWNEFKNKLLHLYYQEIVEDRQLVEGIFCDILIPFNKPSEQRMKLFYALYFIVDDSAIRALAEMLKARNLLRSHVKRLTTAVVCANSEKRVKYTSKIIEVLSRNFSDAAKTREVFTKFATDLENNMKLRIMISSLTDSVITCSAAKEKLEDVLNELGSKNSNEESDEFKILKKLLIRILPIFDMESIEHLVSFVTNSLVGNCSVEADLGLEDTGEKGLQMLKMLSLLYPALFRDEKTFKSLIPLLKFEKESVTITSLQILCSMSFSDLNVTYPSVYEQLLPTLLQFSEFGIPLQAKHSVLLLNKIVPGDARADFFVEIMKNLQNYFTLESPFFKTALVSSGHIAQSWRHLFPSPLFKDMVTFVVTTVLMHDGEFPREGTNLWGTYDSLPDETKVKIEGMKCIVRWLTGVEKFVKPTITTLRCLSTYLENGGDLTETKHNSAMENSWLRLSAACRMLKLCHVPNYEVELNLKQFHILAYVLIDNCPQVCDEFAKKLYKALLFFKLPIEYLAIFAVAGFNERKEFKAQVKNYLSQNVKRRRQRLTDPEKTNADILAYLPDYSLPCAVHLLAHAPFFTDPSHIPTLLKIKECLKWFMDCLIVENNNYSYSFFKRLLENIKQTKDILDPEDENVNMRMYAVCDLALNIVMTQKKITLRDFPGKPVLNKRFFTEPDYSYSNMKTYLPPELLRKLKASSDLEVAENLKDQSSFSLQEISTVSMQKDQNHSRSIGEGSNVSDDESAMVNLQNGNTDLLSSNESEIESLEHKNKKSKKELATRNGPIRKRGRPAKQSLNKIEKEKESVPVSKSKTTISTEDKGMEDLSSKKESTLITSQNSNGKVLNGDGPARRSRTRNQKTQDPVSASKSEISISSNEEMEDLSSEKELTLISLQNGNCDSGNSGSNLESVGSKENKPKKTFLSNTTGFTRKRGRPAKKHPKINFIATNSDQESLLADSITCSSEISVSISDSDTIRRLIKDCNVSLKTDEIQQYMNMSKFPLGVNDNFANKRKRGASTSKDVANRLLQNESSLNVNGLPKKTIRKTRKLEINTEAENVINRRKEADVSSVRSLRSKASTVDDTPNASSSTINGAKTNSSVHSMESSVSAPSSIIKYAPRMSGATSVIVQNSVVNDVVKAKSNVQSNQSSITKDRVNPQKNKKPLTRSNKVKSVPKSVVTNERRTTGRQMSLRNKVTNEKPKPNRR